MKYFFLILFSFSSVIYSLNESPPIVITKKKQHHYFPKELIKKGVYLGMTLDKLRKKNKEALAPDTTSPFKIEVIELSNTDDIVSYTYLFTKKKSPLLYQIIITYPSMEGVHDRAITILGDPNHKGEWRIQPKVIKEDFMMGIWTFGQKWVFSSTLVGSEWEKGFSN